LTLYQPSSSIFQPMDIGKTGSTLFRMYTGAVVLMWAVLLIIGGGMLLYLGFEPFRMRAYVMIGIGLVIIGLSALTMMGGGKKSDRFADDAQRSYDADEAIRRYLQQKAEAKPESAPAAIVEAPAAAHAPAAPQRPVFGRRGVA
jgi:type IV secretory pathway VirB2 component (pilin)